MAFFDHRHHANLFRRDLAHPNWGKIGVIAGTVAFWIAAIEVVRVVF